MTREAKIGMLTGLGVIVLIGALLSEYLEPAKGGPAEQNRMASLPIGASYRDTVIQPPMAPGTMRVDAGQTSPATAGTDPVAAQIAALPPAFAADNAKAADPSLGGAAPGQPTMQSPVTPINDGQVLASADQPMGQPPVIQVGDAQQVSGGGAATAVASFPTPVHPAAMGQQYVIAPGDTLGKIAKKFYHSSKSGELRKIVAANPGVLKSVNTMLIAGRKLMIPDVAPRVAAAPAGSVPMKPAVVIRSPGQTVATVGASGARSLAPAGSSSMKVNAGKKGATIYVVASGDTLNKIAKKISPGNYLAVAKEIAALNKIKDVRGLQVGMKLKLPGA